MVGGCPRTYEAFCSRDEEPSTSRLVHHSSSPSRRPPPIRVHNPFESQRRPSAALGPGGVGWGPVPPLSESSGWPGEATPLPGCAQKEHSTNRPYLALRAVTPASMTVEAYPPRPRRRGADADDTDLATLRSRPPFTGSRRSKRRTGVTVGRALPALARCCSAGHPDRP
jgi:hypothetical protein